MLLSLLSHFVFELFQVLLHQVILIINDRLIAINLLLQLLELQSTDPISHHIYLFLNHISHVFVFILGKHLQTLDVLIHLVLHQRKLILEFTICNSQLLGKLLLKLFANIINFDFTNSCLQ